MVILDLEGELFFGAAPDLDRYFAQWKQKTKEGVRIIILRVKRTRNPDMVCMERFEHFLREMEQQAVTVLLCGVRPDFDQAMENLHFFDWLPASRVFRENTGTPGSATAAAVRYAYDVLGEVACDTCPRRKPSEPDSGALYYVI